MKYLYSRAFLYSLIQPFSGIGGSPVNLKRSSLTSNQDDDTDDGFLEILEHEEQSQDASKPGIPEGMAGLLNAPMVRAEDHSFTPPKRRAENRESERPRLCSRRGLFKSPGSETRAAPRVSLERAHSFDVRQTMRPRPFSKRVEPPARDFTDTPVQTNKRRRSLVYEETNPDMVRPEEFVSNALIM